MSGMGFVKDAELLRRWRDGDQSAGEILFERYYQRIERFFLGKVPDAVEDLVQDTFKRCLEGRDRIHDEERFRSFLFTIAYNVLRAHLRYRCASGREIDVDDVSIADLASSGPRARVARGREHQLLL